MQKWIRHKWVALMMIMLCSAQAAASEGWETYKSRFLQADGRIIDTANKNVSHTEGQGYAMLLAVHYSDRATFGKLWQWTNTTLRDKQNGLFIWRYNPAAANPTGDKNNASDGDILVAWALQRAAEKWQNPAYQQQSDAIQKAIIAHDVIRYAGRTVMLPGAQGFNKTSYVVLNPSYFLFPAFQAFAKRSHLQVWTTLINDSFAMLSDMRFGTSGLPLDWVAMNADGSMAPATGWPPRFSYDAIRVPLYIAWYDAQSLRLVPFQAFWQHYPRQATPAWFDVLSNTPAGYNMNGGLLAVRDLTMGETTYINDRLPADSDYYSASLQLLANMAYEESR